MREIVYRKAQPQPVWVGREEITYCPDGAIDEVVMHGASVHLERLDDHVYMLIVENEHHRWHLNIVGGGTKRHPVVEVQLYESDEKHERLERNGDGA
jgi:hypothetical protein